MTVQFYTFIFFSLIGSYVYALKFLSNSDTKKINFFFIIFLILISAFRWKVGGDWDAYYSIYESSGNFSNLNFDWSFIYRLINSIFWILDLGIYGVNFFVSTIFFYALYSLSRSLKFDFFLLTIISFSLVYFTGIMGYVRQGLALSFLILTFNSMIKNKKKTTIIFFFITVLTHFTSVIFFPIILYYLRSNLKINLLILMLGAGVLILKSSGINSIIEQFVFIGDMRSIGLILRAFTLYFCVLIFIFNYKKILTKSKELNFFLYYSLLLIVFLNGAFFINPSISSITDRLNFYFISFQIIVIGRFYSVIIKSDNKNYIHYVLFLSFLYFMVFYIWLVFGYYSVFYHQYRFLG